MCPDAPEDGGRCDACPLDKLDAAQNTATGLLIRRALALKAALDLGIAVGLDDIRADEFYAMRVVQEERDALEREQANHGRQQ